MFPAASRVEAKNSTVMRTVSIGSLVMVLLRARRTDDDQVGRKTGQESNFGVRCRRGGEIFPQQLQLPSPTKKTGGRSNML